MEITVENAVAEHEMLRRIAATPAPGVRIDRGDDLIASVGCERVVSEPTLAIRINAVRHAIGDDGHAQLLIGYGAALI